MNEDANSSVRLRFPPSPTGHWHLGGARTALFNWLFARKNAGKLVLRIEDTDKARSDQKYEIEIVETMKWLGLTWDEGPNWRKDENGNWLTDSKGDCGPYRQSERTSIYVEYLQKLLNEKKAYFCYCTKEELEADRKQQEANKMPPKYIGRCRDLKEPPAGREPESIRFRMPEEQVTFDDLIRGQVTFDASLFGDTVIAKDLDSPLYNFAVVIDDHLMGISHVIRGEEHLANTPKQILLARAMGFNVPVFAHLPLILAANRSKLSKRYAETSMLQYREDGYLPEAILNFLVLLGWHPPGDEELFSLDEMVAKFDLARVQKSGAIFNPDKLDWLNGQYLRKLPDDELAERARPFLPKDVSNELLIKLVRMERDRIQTLKELADHTAFVFSLPDYDPALLIWKKSDHDHTATALKESLEIIRQIPENKITDREELQNALEPIVSRFDRGTVFWPLRVSLSGQEHSPDPLAILGVLDKEESIRRIEAACAKLS